MKKYPYRLGWIKDKPDSRDLNFSVQFRLPAKLPPSADLRSGCSPVEDQGQLGSCTAQALIGALEYLEIQANAPFADLSRLFVYYNERPDPTVDSGAQIRDGIKSLAKIGVCREDLWPYAIDQFAVKPPDACYLAAGNHVITQYTRLNTLNDMKSCLAMGYPFVFGWKVYQSAMTDKVKASGDIPMPGFWERHFTQPLGGHAVLGCGFDDKTKKIMFKNSWSTSWGDSGFGYLPYAYFNDPNLSSDFWYIELESNNNYSQIGT